MYNQIRKTEAGQAIVLIALAIIGLVGFTALAIDGGNAFVNQQSAQGAADSAAFSAALSRIRDGDNADINAIAYNIAIANGYDPSDPSISISVHTPPVSGPFACFAYNDDQNSSADEERNNCTARNTDHDIDKDGIDNEHDDDIDGDGIDNEHDDDVDGDGHKNGHDDDVDGDGVDNDHDDDIDGDGHDNDHDDDDDGDGRHDDEDDDDDGDGIDDKHDDIDGDGHDSDDDDDDDGDGIPDHEDNDDDGDGIDDDEDDDYNGDGVKDDKDNDLDGDCLDNDHDDDIDGDGIDNDHDDDIDGDGHDNDHDDDDDGDKRRDRDHDKDDDNDGIDDKHDDLDHDGHDSDDDHDDDGDGIDDEHDHDMDGDGHDNEHDDDIDGDGIRNDEDHDIDGDGHDNDVDHDMDGDGVDNENDDDMNGDGINDDLINCEEYIQVIITSEIDTYFAPVVGIDSTSATVSAVARAKLAEETEMYYGNAVVSLKPSGTKTFWLNGTPDVTTVGGGFFVNSSTNCGYTVNGNPNVTTPSITMVASGSCPNNVGEYNAPPADYPPPDYMFPEYTCDYTHSGNFPPSGTGTTNLPSGVHCVNGNFRLNGNDVLTGTGVTIVMESGEVHLNGNGELNLSAPTSGATKGLLLYMPMSNSNTIKINGNSQQTLRGTIFAPASNITMLGTADTGAFQTQVVGYQVKFSGTFDGLIEYNNEQNYNVSIPPLIELAE